MRQNSSGSTIMAVICTIGIFLFIGLLCDASTPTCSMSGCTRDQVSGSKYCIRHKYSFCRSSHKSSSSSSTGSSSSKSSSSGSASSGSSNSGSSSSSSCKSSNSSKKTTVDSYDKGYDDIYEDDDYDEDRYNSDSDYATGVDDAMEDLDW